MRNEYLIVGDQQMRSPRTDGFVLRGAPTPFRELVQGIWRKRSLIRMLARRDFHVRYRRASFGLIWVAVVPIAQAAVLTVIFSVVVRVPTGGVPRALFILSGLLPWMFVSGTLSASVTSITGGASLAAKVYFPRAILPLMVVRSNLYGYGTRVVVVLIAAVAFGVGIGPSIVLLVPATILMILFAAAFALVLAALHVYFRDISFIVQVAIQAWFYASGVFFPVDLVPQGLLRTAVELNPATGIIHLFRSAIVGAPPELSLLMPVAVWIAALTALAVVLYRRFDRVFIDLL